ncbi:mannosyl phosphorylinositol ceramide synthase [Cedratvirus lausannensis]|uniref:Mannosyl phosphorylinositol ceramide synthase n=2 Tax=Pithoviruses TaxID=2023203 RepID=A0A285PWB3_9VIRU|nr:mannosyl phosphorylinositol ceramide synthase [Cedratvirus lausannensis]SPN79880.1 Mannosyl phosphorylinositol ceramide synthase [Cedratvirus Zaza IHUMI]
MAIPKIIMQTWKTRDVPDKWKSSPQAISRLMPEYQYYLFSDDDNERFVRKHFPQYLPLWNSLKYGIQKADVIRYMFLYRYGGYYLDLDLEPQRSFDELPQADLLLVPSANNLNCLTNSFLASTPEHPFWLELLDNLNKPPVWAIGKHLEVMYSTGPGILNKVIRNSSFSFLSLSPLLLGSACICNYNKESPGTFFKTLEGGSWLSPQYMFFMKLFLCSGTTLLAVVLGVLLVLVVLSLTFLRFPSSMN